MLGVASYLCLLWEPTAMGMLFVTDVFVKFRVVRGLGGI